MSAWDFIKNVADTAKEYQGLVKTGIAALGTYASYKDQQKKMRCNKQLMMIIWLK